MKRFVPNLLLAVASTLLCAIAIEVGLRITKYSTPIFRQPDYYSGSRLTPGAYYRQTKEGGSEGYINSKGLRDYEYPYEKDDHTFRILIVGDSYTEAIQVPLEDTYPKLLEKKLEESPPMESLEYEVINMGVSGAGTANSYYQYLSEGIKYDPDLVVLAFCTGNDFRNNFKKLEGYPYRPYFYINSEGALAEDLSFRERLASRLEGWRHYYHLLKLKSYFISFLAIQKAHFLKATRKGLVTRKITDTVVVVSDWKVYLKDLPPEWAEAYEVTKRVIRLFSDRVHSNGADFLLVTLTNGTQISDRMLKPLDRAFGRGKYDLEKPDRELWDFAKRNDIDLFQLLPIFRKQYEETGTYYHGFENAGGAGSDGHWNQQGHELAATSLFKFLTTYIPDRAGNRRPRFISPTFRPHRAVPALPERK